MCRGEVQWENQVTPAHVPLYGTIGPAKGHAAPLHSHSYTNVCLHFVVHVTDFYNVSIFAYLSCRPVECSFLEETLVHSFILSENI